MRIQGRLLGEGDRSAPSEEQLALGGQCEKIGGYRRKCLVWRRRVSSGLVAYIGAA